MTRGHLAHQTGSQAGPSVLASSVRRPELILYHPRHHHHFPVDLAQPGPG